MKATIIALSILVCASLVAAPAAAQQRHRTARSNPGVQVLKGTGGARTTPGVQVRKTRLALRRDHGKLRRATSDALLALGAAKRARGARFGAALKALQGRVDGVRKAGLTSSWARLTDGDRKRYRKASTTVSTIAQHERKAASHVRAARVAHKKGQGKAARRELDKAQVHLRALDRLSGVLGKMEPVVSR